MKHKKLINEMIKDCCVFDIETSSNDHLTGRTLDIKTEFDKYVENAIIKWIGIYSYKYNKYYPFNALKQKEQIKYLLSKHKTLIGFNNEKFDTPVLKNNGLLKNNYVKQLDIQVILGNNQAYGHKGRAEYMGVNLKFVEINGVTYGENTLMSMAKHFNLDIIKGDIDYKILYKNVWTEDEEQEIKKYLKNDVKITKLLFEKLVKFWSIFTDWLYEKDIKNWIWLRSSISSLTYHAACNIKNVNPTFNNEKDEKEDMGGRAVKPCQEETYNVHYLDEASKYPHIFSEFNLFNEINPNNYSEEVLNEKIKNGEIFHGNEVFKINGYYYIGEHGVLEKDLITKLKTRFAIKNILKTYKKTGQRELEDVCFTIQDLIPNNYLTNDIIVLLQGLEYAIKIFTNSLYGAVRSSKFEQISTENAGYDCCWIGQQIHKYIDNYFSEKGFKIIGGFTDSWFFEHKEGYTKQDIIKIANECMNELKKCMPFPADSHIIDYERFINYIVYHYDDKKGEYKKNNYAFLCKNEVKIVGFPIIKNNASKLAIHIFNKYLKNEGIKKNRLKFDENYIRKLIINELEQNIKLAAVNYKCNAAKSYKNPSQLQAQISRVYSNGLDGNVNVIKNKKIGGVGKGDKYCTIEEALEKNLKIKDLVLNKVWNELDPFIIRTKPPILENWKLM